jgi:hypothetical protein
MAVPCIASGVAAAEETVPPVIVRTSSTRTCVATSELGEMLRRAGVRSVAERAQAQGAVEVDVNGPPEHLTVVVRGEGHDTNTTLAPTTCATATDVVAAFVVSMLTPVFWPPTRQDLTAAELERDVKDELARRGIQLASIGRRLRIRRDDPSTFYLELDVTDAPDCKRTVPLGTFGETSPLRTAALADVAKKTLAEQDDCIARPPEPSPRLRALREAVHEVDKRAELTNWMGGLELATGAGLLLFLAGLDAPNVHLSYSTTRDAFVTSSGVLLLGGGAATLLVDDDLKIAVGGSTVFAGIGSLFTGAAIENKGDAPDYSFAALAAAGYSTSALIALNGALHRPPIRRIRALRAELEARRPSDRAIAEAERAVESLSNPIPPTVMFAPLLLGGTVAVLPAAVGGFENKDRTVVAVFGATLIVDGIMGMLTPNIGDRYRWIRDQSGIVGATLGVGPGDRGGLSLSGRF